MNDTTIADDTPQTAPSENHHEPESPLVTLNELGLRWGITGQGAKFRLIARHIEVVQDARGRQAARESDLVGYDFEHPTGGRSKERREASKLVAASPAPPPEIPPPTPVELYLPEIAEAPILPLSIEEQLAAFNVIYAKPPVPSAKPAPVDPPSDRPFRDIVIRSPDGYREPQEIDDDRIRRLLLALQMIVDVTEGDDALSGFSANLLARYAIAAESTNGR